MSAEVYSVPGQTEGRKRAFLESASIDLSSNLIHMSYMWGNVNYYESVHHPITTLPVRIGNTLEIFKTDQ